MAFTLSTIYKAVDKVTPILQKMERANSSFAMKQDKMFAGISSKMSNMRDQLIGLAGGISIASLFFMGGNAIVKFDDSIASLSAVTGVVGKDLDGMKKQILELADQSKIAAYDIAKGFEIVGSAMSQYLKDPVALRQITGAGITLSKAARMEMEPALDSLTSVMNQFMIKADQAKKTVDILTAGEIVGSVRTTEIASSLQEFGAVAYTANVKLSESVALIEALGKQMEVSKIGVGARNLLTIINSAKGLDKEALKSLQANRINTNLLMDSKVSLGDKLKELSKIQNDAVGMVKVFGKENLTAAKVIFNQLPTYNEYFKAIENTSEADHQAAINSASFANSVKQLKAKFENLIISGNETSGVLNKFGKILGFVTNHLGAILAILGTTLVVLGTYYILMSSLRIIITGYNIALGVWMAFQKVVPVTLGKNTTALKSYTFVSKMATAAQWLWNAACAANPITWVVLGIVAAVAAIALLVWKWKELNAWWEKSSLTAKILLAPLLLMLKPLIDIAHAIRDIIDNWSALSDAFTKGGFLEGIKKFGKMWLANMLEPVQKYLSLIGKIPGFKWAAQKADEISKYRSELVGNKEDVKPVNLQKTSNDVQSSYFEEIQHKIQLEIFNKSDKQANVKSNSPAIPVTTNTF